MASGSGPLPWTSGYGEWLATHKRITAGKVTRRNAYSDWSLSSGYRTPDINLYDDVHKPKYKEVTTSSGRKVKVNDTDYDNFFYFQNKDPITGEPKAQKTLDYEKEKELGDYIEKALYGDAKVIDQPGCGHITSISYSPYYQVMEVSFEKGAVVSYLAVPSAVFYELRKLAEDKATNHEGRHLLGVRFWDIVRNRGQVHGSKYDFRYTAGNELTGRGSQEKYLNELTPGSEDDQEDLDYIQRHSRKNPATMIKLGKAGLDALNKAKTTAEAYKILAQYGADDEFKE